MSRRARILQRVLGGRSDASIRFEDLCGLLRSLRFAERIKGSHDIFRKAGVGAKINLQRDGSHAKPYQVKQVRQVLKAYLLKRDN